MVRTRLKVDLVQAKSAGEGLQALGDRIPDLILTPALLSPFDDGVLDEYLRELGAAGAHVQTVRIPILNAEPRKNSFADRLFVLGRGRNKPSTSSAAPDGCDPTVFADEIAAYLSRAASARQTVAQVAEVLSRHEEAMSRPQEQLPPAPADAGRFGSAPSAVSQDFIAEFNDAIVLTDAPVAEPRYVEPQYIEPQYIAAFETQVIDSGEPAPGIVSEPTYVTPSASSDADVSRLGGAHVVDAMRHPEPVTPHEPIRQTRDTSATFEAALAAIRAAWIKPDATPTPESSPDGSAARRPAAVNDAPPAQREAANTPGKTAPPDGRQMPDEWGMFDAEKCGFPALIEKLEEVAESKDARPRRAGTSTVISIR